ncbi:hypothetical protein Ppa06_39870 [Planomonospora parontospora subsp. parontospora]|uniref:Uncharacterized protein n=2 Tax=Planomonospora parontospora TaxID=58119 RepID=A0AA37F5T7_9ACTN|nr:hypothetical protein GCM10010126_39050 [Planomonospora parontospora]GII10189.1 hypothetical protein Ppa06_39870 [Planomonospora parontospora subsp. parontospora]
MLREAVPEALPVEAFAASNTVTLAVANEPAAGTIETVLAESDLKLGVEALAGAPAQQANPFADASPVRVRHPLAADDTDETPWLTGLVASSASISFRVSAPSGSAADAGPPGRRSAIRPPGWAPGGRPGTWMDWRGSSSRTPTARRPGSVPGCPLSSTRSPGHCPPGWPRLFAALPRPGDHGGLRQDKMSTRTQPEPGTHVPIHATSCLIIPI